MANLNSSSSNEMDGHHLKGKFKTHKEMAIEMGISHSAYFRKLKLKGYKSHHRLLTPKEQDEILTLFGFL